MSAPIIQVKNLAKLYRLGEVSTGTLSHDLNRWWHRMRGKEDPYSLVGQANDRTKKADGDWVYALKDISFNVDPGEVLGVIGRNGAGKSTLLKIMSRVTAPTSGSIKVKGRIASLLEVGTGFHPELTGRENIYLNGAILGMRRYEIHSKLDEIVDFSGCAAYLDTPVKRYSSGMYVRLAFAVAAHLDPEILIVDEVLAVGDAEFQRKCLSKMEGVARLSGRTVIFVSHNMAALKAICSRAILINQGGIETTGSVTDVIHRYSGLAEYARRNEYTAPKVDLSHPFLIRAFIANSAGQKASIIRFDESFSLRVLIKCPESIRGLEVTFRILTLDRVPIFTSSLSDSKNSFKQSEMHGQFEFEAHVPDSFLMPGVYAVNIALHKPNIALYEHLESVLDFSVLDTGSAASAYGSRSQEMGSVFAPIEWINKPRR